MNAIMVWAWRVWSAYAVEHERYYGLGMGALVTACSRTCTLLWFGHGCSGHRMQSNMNVIMVWVFWSPHAVEHERYHGLGEGMQSNMNVLMAWAWMVSLSYAVGHEHFCGLGMDALVIVCS